MRGHNIEFLQKYGKLSLNYPVPRFMWSIVSSAIVNVIDIFYIVTLTYLMASDK